MIQYWEERYKSGGNSGPGSYGNKAKYKAKVLNEIIEKYKINSLIEFGCGDGNNLQYYKINSYTGLDVSRTAIKQCIEKYKDDDAKSFLYYEPELFKAGGLKADLTISFEVIFHLINDDIYQKYMIDLFNTSNDYVLIFSSNHEKKPNIPHVKHREFVKDTPDNFNLLKSIKTPIEDLFSDFYLFKRRNSLV